MHTSNSVPADSENTSPFSIVWAILWAWSVSVLLLMLRFYAWDWVVGALKEFGFIHSDRCERHNAEIRANSRQLWTRTVTAFRDMRSHRDINMPAHQNSPRSSASTRMTASAAGRQSGKRRISRHGGQAKKASNDPDGGDGEPPRPSHSLSSSRPRTPPLRHRLTRPVIAGGAR